jgi:hypothetical protein
MNVSNPAAPAICDRIIRRYNSPAHAMLTIILGASDLSPRLYPCDARDIAADARDQLAKHAWGRGMRYAWGLSYEYARMGKLRGVRLYHRTPLAPAAK